MTARPAVAMAWNGTCPEGEGGDQGARPRVAEAAPRDLAGEGLAGGEGPWEPATLCRWTVLLPRWTLGRCTHGVGHDTGLGRGAGRSMGCVALQPLHGSWWVQCRAMGQSRQNPSCFTCNS